MGDHDAHGPSATNALEQEFQHAQRPPRVQIAGRLVAQHQPGRVDQGAGNGHPLHFPAGQMPRPVVGAPVETDSRQHGPRPLVRLDRIPVEQPQRQGDILRQGEMRQEMKGLKDEAEVPPPQAGEGILIQGRQVPVPQLDPAPVHPLQSGDAVEQGGFADPRLAHDGHGLPGRQKHGHRGKEWSVLDGIKVFGQIVDCKHRGPPAPIATPAGELIMHCGNPRQTDQSTLTGGRYTSTPDRTGDPAAHVQRRRL